MGWWIIPFVVTLCCFIWCWVPYRKDDDMAAFDGMGRLIAAVVISALSWAAYVVWVVVVNFVNFVYF